MTRYLSLAEFWYLAENVTGINAPPHQSQARRPRRLRPPRAPGGFDDTDFYPELHNKAAMLTCQIAWNHPGPDGNKRAASACLVLFNDLNDGLWNDEQPDTPTTSSSQCSPWRRRDIDKAWLANWLRVCVTFRI